MTAFSVPIAAIFARELLEACVIVGQYRSVVKAQEWDEGRIARGLRTIWLAAGAATAVALVLIVGLGIGLAAAGSEMDEKAAEIIEGISKVVAAICIAQLSLKVPKWLGMYPSSQKDIGVSDLELRFNVAWNIWREVAEIGVFLIPSFLKGTELAAIPLSGAVGIAVGLILGVVIYVLNRYLERKRWALALFMVLLTGLLATGLFTGGCHEFEEVWGETSKVYKLPGDFFSHKKLPLVVIKPFGYSQSPTVLMMCCFWLFGGLLVIVHILKYLWMAKKAQAKKDQGQQQQQQQQQGQEVRETAV